MTQERKELNIELSIFRILPGKGFHDRFIIIDDELYSVGSSIKDIGKKISHISKLDYISINDDDEFLLPEDMIGAVKKIVLETWHADVVRDTNEVPAANIIK